ncbi:T9SS type A sorting domain-containing protein [Aquimarina sp. MMG016]|uniref:T9SS type A sorting domain-containing protein n=1 Tax=Aquimarina sp. MMG016 TaxID=2822690 RepID=UPI001B3A2BAE|nr:T9SS type A sorting domain-containing protein [Aquimarina sp. MMG016]MBQ4818438.1 T9SS type A sorting domain-containing protein [Aquimarina sp. MMG016]
MKTKLPGVNVSLKIVYAFLFFIGTVYSGFAQANPRLTMVYPVENSATVTLTNFGDSAVDLNDYWLCLRPGTYRQLKSLTNASGDLNVMPSGSVTVSYNVEVGVASDGLSLYLPNTPSDGGFGIATNLIDFVQWGAAGNIREPLAVAQGLWTEGDFIVGPGPYTYAGNGTQNGLGFWSACTADGGEITSGPFSFTVDGIPDNVSGVSVSGSSGSNASWVITDDRGTILGLPPTVTALEGVDFDGAGVGTCLIWYIRYEDGLEGLEPGNNALTDLDGCYDLSNSIEVVRNEAVDGGEIEGGPFTFCVDGEVDNVSDISLSGNAGNNSTWVITDDQGLILGLPPTIEAVEGVDFDGAGAGVCLIWHLSYEDGLEGLEPGNNALTDLSGIYDLSNSISVTRNDPDGGEITGGPFSFTVDGIPDNVSGVSVSGSSGGNASWVITDDRGTILGLPPTVTALEGVDFDGAGVGTCLIWYIRYEDGLEGLEPGNNALTDLDGCYDLSNSIEVVRNEQIELNAVVFPNPASRFAYVIIRGLRNSNLTTQLFDMSGNPVDVEIFQRRNFVRINVGNLQSGVYLVLVNDSITGGSAVRQIVVRN